MTSAAIYARVSSARQKKDQTIGSQTAALREHAAQSRLDVPAEWIFQDEGHSGATLVRPALEALDRAKLQAGQGRAGLADFQVRSDIAIRRHQALVCCAFNFCWAAWFADPAPSAPTPPPPDAGEGERGSRARWTAPAAAMLATGTPRRARLAHPLEHAAALMGHMVRTRPRPRQLPALMTSLEAATAWTSTSRVNKLPLGSDCCTHLAERQAWCKRPLRIADSAAALPQHSGHHIQRLRGERQALHL